MNTGADWYGGTHCEAVTEANRLVAEMIRSAGGDPFLGARLGVSVLGQSETRSGRDALTALAAGVDAWTASPDAVSAIAECSALARKS